MSMMNTPGAPMGDGQLLGFFDHQTIGPLFWEPLSGQSQYILTSVGCGKVSVRHRTIPSICL